MSKFSHMALIFMTLIGVFSVLTFAQAQEWSNKENLRGRLIPTPGHEDVQALLELRLSQGWHTYWRVAGDSGLPPRFDWSKSENIETPAISWPFPTRFDEFGLQTFGYKTEVHFPVAFKLIDHTKPANLDVKIDIMICNEICVPEQLELQAVYDPKAEPNQLQMVEYKKRSIPAAENTEGLKIEGAVLGPDALVLNVFSKKGFKRADVFPVMEDFALSAKPEIILDEKDKRKAMFRIPKTPDIDNLSSFLEGKTLSVVLVAEKEAVRKDFSF